MLREKRERQQMDLVILEQMIPEDHLLRRIDTTCGFQLHP